MSVPPRLGAESLHPAHPSGGGGAVSEESWRPALLGVGGLLGAAPKCTAAWQGAQQGCDNTTDRAKLGPQDLLQTHQVLSNIFRRAETYLERE